MLVVINPRIDPEATFRGWIKYNAKLIVTTLIWAVALLAIAALGQPTGASSGRWHSVSFAEGAAVYTPYATQDECLEGVVGDMEECIAGQNLLR